MSLQIGQQLGSYQITSLIGKGGMGEVYRAKDTKLKRDVAIKILPDEFSRDTDRVARFQREAESLAALNHQNIAAIYDLQQSDATRFLILEFVEGETLADRIARGPLPLDESLNIAKQICEALEAAHEKGIIHRDLKPANVKITPDGKVKVLDFGLAKAFELEASKVNLSQSPTLSMAATNAGVILGTAAYMSPEQAKGKTVDRRADIWAFGVVMCEMITGRQLFSGETASETMAAVMMKEADWKSLPANTPARLRELLRRCLIKEPRNRLQAIGEARLVLSGSMEEEPPVMDRSHMGRTSKLAWGLASLPVVVLGVLGFVHLRETAPVQQSLRFQIPPPGASVAQHLALSPDGRNLAFIASEGRPARLWVRSLDALESRALAGTDGGTYPFWSPDGTYLGFFQQGKLKKIAVEGGAAQTLCDAASGRGGAWNRDGVIVFSPGPTSELFRVSSAGGVAAPVTKLVGAGAGHRFPSFLPDGVHFLYNAGSDKPEFAGLYVGSLDGGAPARILPDATNAVYAPPPVGSGYGHLLFRREDTLMAQPFDAKSLQAAGDLFPIAEQVALGGNNGFGAFSVSENGMLVYRSGDTAGNRELVWMDRSGKKLGAVSKSAAFLAAIALSPDEKTVAASIGTTVQADIWLQDLGRDVISRFTFRSGGNRNPVWSPDGSRMVFALQDPSAYSSDLYQKPTAGNGKEELLLHGGINAAPSDWSSDGKFLVYAQTGEKTGNDMWLLPDPGSAPGERKPIPYLQTPFDESKGRFSPDGRWMAYVSNESGERQVYIQAVPPSGAKWQISTSAATSALGVGPTWRGDGKELYYGSADEKLMAVPVKLGSSVEPGTPQTLFSLPGVLGYAPSRDGQRFLVNAPAGGEGAAVPPVTVVTNWQAGLKK